MLPDTPPVAIEPVAMAVCAVAAALIWVRTHPAQLPNKPARTACSENWTRAIRRSLDKGDLAHDPRCGRGDVEVNVARDVCRVEADDGRVQRRDVRTRV